MEDSMKLAIMSDTHDNIWKIDEALAKMQHAEALIHCGDLCSPFVIKHLGKGAAGRPVHIIWGNNDGDVRLICQLAERFQNISLHGAFAELNFSGLRVALNHYPEIARGLAASGLYDLVCYGHDHQAHVEQLSDCVLLNPGELMGMYGKRTFAFFDTLARQAELVEV
jgi:putative phosphoesterase